MAFRAARARSLDAWITIPSRIGTVHDGLHLRHPVDLDHAHAALADDGELRVVAEVGDVDPRRAARLEGVRGIGDLDGPAVDRDLRHQS